MNYRDLELNSRSCPDSYPMRITTMSCYQMFIININKFDMYLIRWQHRIQSIHRLTLQKGLLSYSHFIFFSRTLSSSHLYFIFSHILYFYPYRLPSHTLPSLFPLLFYSLFSHRSHTLCTHTLYRLLRLISIYTDLLSHSRG